MSFRERGHLALLVDSCSARSPRPRGLHWLCIPIVRSPAIDSLLHRPLRVCSVVARWLPKPATSQLPHAKRTLRDPWCHPTFLTKRQASDFFNGLLELRISSPCFPLLVLA